MIIIPGKLMPSGKDTLARCGCSHSWLHDIAHYRSDWPHFSSRIYVFSHSCPKCHFYAWTIRGMDYVRLRKP